MKTLKRLAQSDAATTAIEYGLIAGAIAVACVAGYTGIGERIVAIFQSLAA